MSLIREKLKEARDFARTEKLWCSVCGKTATLKENVFPCDECRTLVCNWHAGQRMCCKSVDRMAQMTTRKYTVKR